MNIFELTRILNEMNAQDVKDAISDYNKVVSNITNSKRRNNETETVLQNREKLFRKITNVVNQEKEMIANNTSQGIVAKFLERAKAFIASDTALSHENDLAVIRDIMSTIDNKTMYQILGYTTNLGTGKRKEVLTLQQRDLPVGRFNLTTYVKDSSAINRLFNFVPGTTGPGEVLLGLIFNGSKVSGRENYGMKGDVVFDGIVYEVKRNGTGCIDKGLEKFQKMLKSANNEDKQKLQAIIDNLKIAQSQESNALGDKVRQYVKSSLKEQQKITTSEINNYFALLDDEDKKRAVLFGFHSLGYKNIIVADPSGRIVVVTDEMIQNFISGGDFASLKINLLIPNMMYDTNSEVKTADFGKIKISIA